MRIFRNKSVTRCYLIWRCVDDTSVHACGGFGSVEVDEQVECDSLGVRPSLVGQLVIGPRLVVLEKLVA